MTTTKEQTMSNENATTPLYTAIRAAIREQDAEALKALVAQGDADPIIEGTNSWPYVRAAARKVIREDASTTWEERLSIDRDAAIAADAAWEADLDNDDLKKSYEAAKKEYRQAEREAFAAGFHWTCGRCGGDGRWVNGGVCFNCGGSGFHPNQTPFKFQASPAVRAKRQAEHDAKRAAEQAAFTAYLVTLPSEVAFAIESALAKFDRLGGFYSEDGAEEMSRDECFAYSMGEKIKKWGSLSAKQIDAVQRGIDRNKKREAEAEALKSVEPLAEGRITIEGEVLTIREPDRDAQFPAWKWLVKMDDGNKVWGSIPNSLGGNERKGDRVKFSADVTRSNDDEHFGFYKRPTKAEIVRSADATTAGVN